MALKLGFAVCLVLAQQRFLQNKGLVLIILTSLLATFIISVLHSFVPGFLVSITDNIAGIIVALLAAIWAVAFLIGAVMSVTKAVF
jgi:VanZ family protein